MHLHYLRTIQDGPIVSHFLDPTALTDFYRWLGLLVGFHCSDVDPNWL